MGDEQLGQIPVMVGRIRKVRRQRTVSVMSGAEGVRERERRRDLSAESGPVVKAICSAYGQMVARNTPPPPPGEAPDVPPGRRPHPDDRVRTSPPIGRRKNTCSDGVARNFEMTGKPNAVRAWSEVRP